MRAYFLGCSLGWWIVQTIVDVPVALFVDWHWWWKLVLCGAIGILTPRDLKLFEIQQ